MKPALNRNATLLERAFLLLSVGVALIAPSLPAQTTQTNTAGTVEDWATVEARARAALIKRLAESQQTNPPAPAATPQPSVAAATTEKIAGGRTLYSFRAEGLELKTALATFARANGLNIVADLGVTGQVTVDLYDLPLDKVMQALLEAHDFSWADEGGLIRVRAAQTRMFTVDYLRLSRKGIGKSTATLGSGTSGGAGGGGSGGGGGGGGGSGGGGAGGGSSGGGSTSFSTASSSVDLTADNPVDFWKEMIEEIGFMLTDAGKHSLSINKTAGIIQITDRPSALKRVENYLASVDISVHRQVDIEAKLYDVTLSDQFQFGVDWVHVAKAYGGSLGIGTSTLPVPIGGAQLQDSALGGVNRLGIIGTSLSTTPGGNPTTLVFENFNTAAAVNALQQQGIVEVISTPRIRTLNNQTALIKVGEEVPFFNTTTTIVPGTTAGTSTVLQQTVVNSVTIGTILSITPQISSDEWISLDVSPVLTSLKSVVAIASGGGGGGGGGGTGGSGATAPDLDTKQASTLVRVRDGTTVVLGGLIQTQKANNATKVPLLGDIPWLGKLFTGTLKANQKKELVIFVTPHIVQ
ncbi:MAG TPA: secretin N-terminal domain-containing protein [Verrucomicrobiae bacterium]